MVGHVSLNAIEYPIKSVTRTIFSEFASAIREGQVRRVDRAFADFREEGTGYPKGLGYKRGRQVDVEGGAWKCELRIEIPGQITLPLEMESQTIAAGDLSGEVAAAGRMCSVNSDLGSSTGKKRTYVTVGTKLLRTVSDTDFTLEDSDWTIPTGSARIYCMWEGWFTASATGILTRALFLGIEDPTTGTASGLLYTTDPTASPPVFTDVEVDNAASTDGRPNNVYFGVSMDIQRKTFICWDNPAGTTEWEANSSTAGVSFGYLNYSNDVDDAPTMLNTELGDENGNVLHKGCQLAGVIGFKLWIIDPLQDAQANPNVTRILRTIDTAANFKIEDIPTRTRNVTWACRYDLPSGGRGIAYGDGQSAYWTNGTTHVSLNVLRHQGRDVAATIKGPNPTGDRLSLLWQADTNLLAWWEDYLPERNAWYPFSKRFVTAAAVVLPGGTIRGTTFPWGAEGLRRYFCDPAAVNSTFVRQKHYGAVDRSNPITTSVGTDDFEDGVLSAEFPMYDAWGGPEENGQLLQGYFEGDANVSADETVLWEYTVDQSTYPDYATYTAVDQTTTLASGGAAARRFGSRCTLNRGSTATKTPNGATFVHRGLKEPATRQRHDYVLDISDDMSQEAKEDLRSEFNTARDALSVLLEDETISTYVYVLGFAIKTVPTGEVGGREEVIGAEFSVLELL